jgi:hypothetical protein
MAKGTSNNPYNEFNRLLGFIDKFLEENGHLYMPDDYLRQFRTILQKAERMNRDKPIPESLGSNLEKNKLGLIICTRCGVSLNPKNLHKHEGRCKPISFKKKDPLEGVLSTTKNMNAIRTRIPERQKNANLKFDLDQSKDSYQQREGGRFGSLPSYDDFGEEAYP